MEIDLDQIEKQITELYDRLEAQDALLKKRLGSETWQRLEAHIHWARNDAKPSDITHISVHDLLALVGLKESLEPVIK